MWVIAAAVLAVVLVLHQRQSPPPIVGVTAPGGELESYRAHHVYVLRQDGFTGDTLPGNTKAEIQAAYQSELAKLRIAAQPLELERVRTDFERDLSVLGWTGSLKGNNLAELERNYQAALGVLLTPYQDIPPQGFFPGDTVRRANGGTGLISHAWFYRPADSWYYGLDGKRSPGLPEEVLTLA